MSWLKPRPTKREPPKLGDDLKRAARRGDFVFGGLAEGVRVNGELHRQLAVAENLDGILGATDEAVGAQEFRSDRFAFGKHIQFLEVDDRILDAERAVKAALGHAAVQRHLSAFKTPAARIATAGLLALVAGAGGLAELGTHAAADANFFLARAHGRLQR